LETVTCVVGLSFSTATPAQLHINSNGTKVLKPFLKNQCLRN